MNSVNLVGFVTDNPTKWEGFEFDAHSVAVPIRIPSRKAGYNTPVYNDVRCVFEGEQKMKWAIGNCHTGGTRKDGTQWSGTKVAVTGRLENTKQGLVVLVTSQELPGVLDTDCIPAIYMR